MRTAMGLLQEFVSKQAMTWGTEAASLPRLVHIDGVTRLITRVLTQAFYVVIALLAAVTLLTRSRDLVQTPEGIITGMMLLLAWAVHSVFIGWSFYHHNFLPLLTVIAVGGITQRRVVK